MCVRTFVSDFIQDTKICLVNIVKLIKAVSFRCCVCVVLASDANMSNTEISVCRNDVSKDEKSCEKGLVWLEISQ